MIWLQTLAFVVLAGLCQAFNGSGPKYIDNSFPYYNVPSESNNRDLFTSSVISISSGPLCSGFHIEKNAVVTAASCVAREVEGDLIVKSYTLEASIKFFEVETIHFHSSYNASTDEHNLAVLIIKNPAAAVRTLRLPSTSSNPKDDAFDATLITKFSFQSNLSYFSTSLYKAETNLNIQACTQKNFEPSAFFCVNQMDGKPYSYGVADLGTPLIYKTSQNNFLVGIFTGHRYNVLKTHYLYQNVYGNLGFLARFVKLAP